MARRKKTEEAQADKKHWMAKLPGWPPRVVHCTKDEVLEHYQDAACINYTQPDEAAKLAVREATQKEIDNPDYNKELAAA